MLILTRARGQMVRIGSSIQICISEINGNSVRIGIDAPREVMVYRTEIYERIQRERAPSTCCDQDPRDH